uniref:Uncharacterized protein n=1 Tax=Opuntia streptacantha TaxID=393608 RepID=A0A7C8ZAG7_OPUST
MHILLHIDISTWGNTIGLNKSNKPYQEKITTVYTSRDYTRHSKQILIFDIHCFSMTDRNKIRKNIEAIKRINSWPQIPTSYNLHDHQTNHSHKKRTRPPSMPTAKLPTTPEAAELSSEGEDDGDFLSLDASVAASATGAMSGAGAGAGMGGISVPKIASGRRTLST